MQQTPFGGISIIISLIIVAIGWTIRGLERLGVRAGFAAERFFAAFVNKEHDTIVRRIFALSIPLNIFILAVFTMIHSFQVLYYDEKRISVFEVIPNSVTLAQAMVTAETTPQPVLVREVITEPIVSSDTLAAHATPPTFLFTRAATSTSLIEFLKANGLDSSLSFRTELATYFGETPYRGTPAENKILLEKLKALTVDDLSISSN